MIQHPWHSVTVILTGKEGECDQVKRLALFFDEIHYIIPPVRAIKPAVLEQVEPGETLDYFEDTYPAMRLDPKGFADERLRETIAVFTEHRVANQLDKAGPNNLMELDRVRTAFMRRDMQDPIFKQLSKTSELDYSPISSGRYRIKRSDNGEEIELHTLSREPNSLADSWLLTTTMFWSNQVHSTPIFLDERHRTEMAYRYEQYRKGIQLLASKEELSGQSDYKEAFGQCAFTLANGVFSSDLIKEKTPQQILQYREAMQEARLRYLATDLIELCVLVEDSPWNETTQREIDKYIQGKLTKDLISFDEATTITWEKLFGQITIGLSKSIRSAVLGSFAVGVAGSVIPSATPWSMLLGALAGAAKESPEIVSALVDAFRETRGHRRNSIAYISRFIDR